MNYKDAKAWIEKLDSYAYISRHGYNEIHFYNKGEYCILNRYGVIHRNPANIPFEDKDDWIIVIPSNDARKILIEDNVFKARGVVGKTSRGRKKKKE